MSRATSVHRVTATSVVTLAMATMRCPRVSPRTATRVTRMARVTGGHSAPPPRRVGAVAALAWRLQCTCWRVCRNGHTPCAMRRWRGCTERAPPARGAWRRRVAPHTCCRKRTLRERCAAGRMSGVPAETSEPQRRAAAGTRSRAMARALLGARTFAALAQGLRGEGLPPSGCESVDGPSVGQEPNTVSFSPHCHHSSPSAPFPPSARVSPLLPPVPLTLCPTPR